MIIYLMFSFCCCNGINVLKSTDNDCIKCRFDPVMAANADRLNYKMVSLFLCSMDRSCKDNVELSEATNETLFKVLNSHPEWVLQVLAEDEENISVDFILEELKRPINDRIDLTRLYSTVQAVNTDAESKSRVLAALSEAISKY